jgi:hypothetical protein
VANMCNAVELEGGAGRGSMALTGSRQTSPSIPPAPASCMKSLSGCGQTFGRLLSVSQKSRNEKCYLREVTVNGTS